MRTPSAARSPFGSSPCLPPPRRRARCPRGGPGVPSSSRRTSPGKSAGEGSHRPRSSWTPPTRTPPCSSGAAPARSPAPSSCSSARRSRRPKSGRPRGCGSIPGASRGSSTDRGCSSSPCRSSRPCSPRSPCRARGAANHPPGLRVEHLGPRVPARKDPRRCDRRPGGLAPAHGPHVHPVRPAAGR